MKKNINLSLYKDNKLEKEYKNINSIYNDKITFIIDNIHTSLNNSILERENEEFLFNIDLENKIAKYLLKEKNTCFDIKVEESSITKEDNIIIIEYKIETDDNKIKIIIES